MVASVLFAPLRTQCQGPLILPCLIVPWGRLGFSFGFWGRHRPCLTPWPHDLPFWPARNSTQEWTQYLKATDNALKNEKQNRIRATKSFNKLRQKKISEEGNRVHFLLPWYEKMLNQVAKEKSIVHFFGKRNPVVSKHSLSPSFPRSQAFKVFAFAQHRDRA